MVRRLRPLLFALVAACGRGAACPEGQALMREDLPCVCGEETLQMLPSCGTLTCDAGAWSLHEGECSGWDTGDSG